MESETEVDTHVITGDARALRTSLEELAAHITDVAHTHGAHLTGIAAASVRRAVGDAHAALRVIGHACAGTGG